MIPPYEEFLFILPNSLAKIFPFDHALQVTDPAQLSPRKISSLSRSRKIILAPVNLIPTSKSGDGRHNSMWRQPPRLPCCPAKRSKGSHIERGLLATAHWPLITDHCLSAFPVQSLCTIRHHSLKRFLPPHSLLNRTQALNAPKTTFSIKSSIRIHP
jgi:hypothetical protein